MVNASAKVAGQKTGDDNAAIIAQLRDIHARLTAGTALTAGQSGLLTNAIGAYLDALDGGASPSLDRTIGLRTWGGVSPARQDRLARRDLLLRDLWRASPEWCGLSASVVARLMVQSAERYEAQRWPREQYRPQPAAQPSATWWQVLSLGSKIPGAKRLQQILEEEIQDGV
ncbi:hypothetical protein AGR7C_Cc160141 [Agrobacterium deltaense Zutra 3/1]|uniref:Uncharacterized protein n=1 Tax=Agrobacterium deltaense Zutra 3/1 TaxID=1183427 RepID=A0A1S7PLM4_9HYPH|nr:hypothetical protein [Agrobacterium deltaense]CUX23225.1 hypothetical protein AGR7C_Cc160141 [Agrobacterium deltaense Zutra 3/1]